MVLHADDVTHSPKLGLDEMGLDARGVGFVEHLKVGDAILPANPENGA